MLSVLACLALACTPPLVASTVTVAGDSVIVTVAVADNASQPVAVDSVRFYIEIDRGVIGGITDTMTATEAHTAGTTTHRFAYPLSLWGAGQTLGGRVGAMNGRVAAGCGGVCWSGWSYSANPGWSYTLDATAPDAPSGISATAALN